MRVISGSARGRRLETPRGDDIRPTSDMVKEAVFSIIQFDLQGARVLDLFAGTGQLGIESLSRGAASCVFVDAANDALQLTRRNVTTCGFESVAEFYRADAEAYLARCGKFDIVFVDPPYGTDSAKKALQKITAFDILNESGIIVCETRTDYDLPQLDAPYEMIKEYRYGKIKITTFTKRNGEKE